MDENLRLEYFTGRQMNKDGRLILSEIPAGRVRLVLPSECVNQEQGTVNLKQLISYLQHRAGEDGVYIEYEKRNMRIVESIVITKETKLILE